MAIESCIQKFSVHQLNSLCEEEDEIKMDIGCKIEGG